MNKNFEVAKILSSIAGFIIIAASLYFSLYQATASYRWNITTSKFLDKDQLANFASYSIKYENELYQTGRFFMIIGLFIAVIALYFTFKGYISKK